jgi:hypothetical protein
MADFSTSMGSTYHVYVMRIWQEQTIPPVLRFILENPISGQRRGFNGLYELTAYLENLTTSQQSSTNPPKIDP